MDRRRRARWLRAAALGALAPVSLLFVGCCLDAPAYHGPVSDHFDGKRFHNADPSDERGAKDLLTWMRNRKHGVWHEHADARPGPPPPAAVAATALRVTFVNHSTVLVQTDGLNILTDPVFSERAGPFSWAGEKRKRPPGIRFDDLPRIDVVLISHNHYDHLDLPTLERLEARDHPRVFTGLGNSLLLAQHGILSTDLDWWNARVLAPGVALTCVPARHFSGRGAFDRQRTLWVGFVVQGPAGAIYFAGDTGYGPHFAAIGERFPGLRLALLPIGSYEPRWFMKPVHLNPADAVQALRDLRAARAIGIHFGTFEQTDEGEDDPAKDLAVALDSAGLPASLFEVPRFGRGIDVPAR